MTKYKYSAHQSGHVNIEGFVAQIKRQALPDDAVIVNTFFRYTYDPLTTVVNIEYTSSKTQDATRLVMRD